MNAEMKFTENNFNFSRTDRCAKEAGRGHGADMSEMRELGVISEDCSCSVFTMLSVAGGILMAVGTVIYALLTI